MPEHPAWQGRTRLRDSPIPHHSVRNGSRQEPDQVQCRKPRQLDVLGPIAWDSVKTVLGVEFALCSSALYPQRYAAYQHRSKKDRSGHLQFEVIEHGSHSTPFKKKLVIAGLSGNRQEGNAESRRPAAAAWQNAARRGQLRFPAGAAGPGGDAPADHTEHAPPLPSSSSSPPPPLPTCLALPAQQPRRQLLIWQIGRLLHTGIPLADAFAVLADRRLPAVCSLLSAPSL